MTLRKRTHTIVSALLIVLVSSLLAAVTGARLAHAASSVITNPYNPAVQYGDSNWRWTNFDHSVQEYCDLAGYDLNTLQCNDAPGASGSCSGYAADVPTSLCPKYNSSQYYQPYFQCAEYVARALAAEGLIPGLTPNSPSSSYADYWFKGTDYHLGNVGVSGGPGPDDYPGLYDYLVNSGMGRDIGDNPAGAMPGDVLFEYRSTPKDGTTREHVTLITQAAPTASNTLVDSHNTATYHVGYYAYGSTVSVVHIVGNSGCAASAATPPNGGVVNATTLDVYVEGNDGNLYNFERSLPSGIWFLTHGTVNNLFIYSPSGHPGGVVYAVGKDSHLYDYYGGTNFSGPNNLTPPSGVAFMCTPSSFTYTDSGGASHDIAFVTASNGHIYDYDWSSAQGWRLTDVSNGGSFVSSPSGHPNVTAPGSSRFVYAVGYDGHLYDYYWTGSAWGGPNNLAPPSGVAFVGSPSSFSYTVSGSSALHDIAFVVGSNGHLYSYEWVQGGGWTLTDLGNGVYTPFVGAPSAFAQ